MTSRSIKSQNIILIGIILGVIIGALLGHYAPKKAISLKFLGDIFLRALFMLVVPLVIVSMISGITHLENLRKLGPLGGRTIAYYLLTTLISVTIGIILVNIIQPGKGIGKPTDYFPQARYQIIPKPLLGGAEIKLLEEKYKFSRTSYQKGYVVKLLDQNLIGYIDSSADADEKKLVVSYFLNPEGKKVEPEPQGMGLEITLEERKFSFLDVIIGLVPRNLFKAMMEDNILSLILFSLILGGILVSLGEKARPLIEFIDSLNLAIMRFVELVMYFAPIGILGLVSARLGQAELSLPGGFFGELARLGKYAGTVIIGLLIHSLIILPLLLKFLGRRKVGEYFKNLLPALLTAFSTASSSATLPVTIDCTRERNRISEKVANFILPLGATINMDGTALYEAVAAIFIAQVYGVPLSFGDQLIVVITATLAAIGAAGIPEAGLITMLIVLKAVNLPTEGIAVILAIDWFLDRCRTTVNVWGDTVGCAVVERLGKIGSAKT